MSDIAVPRPLVDPSPTGHARSRAKGAQTMRTASIAAGAFLLASTAAAHHAGEYFLAGDMVVSHAWMHAVSATADANAVYLTLENRGEAPERLIGAAAGFAGTARFEAEALGEDGTLRTVTVPAIEIAPGQRLTLQPGGVRIVLDGLTRSFTAGGHTHIDLTFEQAGTIEIDVQIEPVDDHHEHEHAS
jgi:periplasmic copper chaperone A